ncbi:MAG: hypothetical protein WCB46_11040 [Methanoregula sp.]
MVAMLAGSLIISPASANPPTEMSLSYHEQSGDLIVVITHPVPNPQEHYIKEVTVTINGKMVNDARYTSQPTPDIFTYTYPITAVPGDKIEVTASCVLSGSLSRQLYTTGPVGTSSSSSPESQPTQQAAEGFVPLLGAAAAFLIRKK